MRNIFLSVLFFFVVIGGAKHAQACLGPPLERTIFFDKVPPDFFPGSEFTTDVVADVVLENINNNGMIVIVTALVTKTIKGKVNAGDRIKIHYGVSSCGPNHKEGEKGIIAAQFSDTGKGHKFLNALTRPKGGYPDRSKLLDLDATPEYGRAPLTVHFSAPAVTEKGTYRIDFGDGQKRDLQKQCKKQVCTVEVAHTYALRGTYGATLKLIPDCKNGNCAAIRTGGAGVTVVGGQEPWASLSAKPVLSKEPPLKVTFMIKGFGGPFWMEYGDGSYGSDLGYILDGRTITATHVFDSPGTFESKLVSRGRKYDSTTITVGKRKLTSACREAIQLWRDGKVAPSALTPVCGNGPIPLFGPDSL
jgi:hypothetical protein